MARKYWLPKLLKGFLVLTLALSSMSVLLLTQPVAAAGKTTTPNVIAPRHPDISPYHNSLDDDTDYGDLPDTYGTTLSNNGARHTIVSLQLGSSNTAETDVQPSAEADSDTGDDGITFSSDSWEAGNTAFLTAFVKGDNGYLVGWFDWNGDGKFDVGEIADFGSMNEGSNSLSLKVPMDASNGTSWIYMRFRLYDSKNLPALSPTGLATNGEVEDYRHSWTPTAVTLARFEAAAQGEAILITWETATELDNLGFNLYRSAVPTGPWTQVNAAFIPAQAPGAVFGAVYELLDTGVTPGAPIHYRLEDVDIHGVSTFHGPISITLTGPSAVSLVSFGATGAAFGLLPALLSLGGLGSGTQTAQVAQIF
ncbi:MAG: GEVED domain-containing protein [Anaerolineae bacterium]|jgi:hypothetical protein|nr:GEVED domain-containing protein [Anaerolineae bacterium]